MAAAVVAELATPPSGRSSRLEPKLPAIWPWWVRASASEVLLGVEAIVWVRCSRKTVTLAAVLRLNLSWNDEVGLAGLECFSVTETVASFPPR